MAKHPSIKPVSTREHICALIHGDPSAGKTSFIGTGGRSYKILIIRPPLDQVQPIRGSGCEEWVVQNWTDAWEALEYCRHDGADWDWVWLDSISLWQDVGLDDIWEQTLDRNPKRREYGRDKLEYGINMERIGEWVRYMVGPDMFNFGITAHSEDLPDPMSDNGGIKRLPWIQGKGMISKVCGYMNVVGYLEVAERERGGKQITQRILRTQKTEYVYAKNQYNAFPPNGNIVDPTMEKFMAGIEEARQAAAPQRREGRRPTQRPAARRTSTRTTRRERSS
jgi:hypothetical protein